VASGGDQEVPVAVEVAMEVAIEMEMGATL